MGTKTIEKRRTKYKSKNKYNDKKKERSDRTRKNDEEEIEVDDEKKEKLKEPQRVSEDVQKMFISASDPYDTPLKWWEIEPVKYAINYPPVKFRLERIMRTHIVRLTDRKYILTLMAKIKEYNEEQQKIRIEKRKISPPSIISRLLKISAKMLAKKLHDPRQQKLKLYV
ncbi:hypothetical protein WH47_06243 [Habropoda laboriosa]|uniref:Uncharacterized protein n=1 Tax=Habropoda laboriosa TaxID=597456 RepID=A0A0L7RJP9_9HYME|nr:PREDICTED: uncharacterized protein LOC108578693 [Habropoda laboriosa]KOC71182.1 hypothetical protein WH47_06243 [Habropoda laboriosa]